MLRSRLNTHVALHLPVAERTPSLHIDIALAATHVTHALCRAVDALEPFGAGNAEPMFLLQNIVLANARRVGADGAHLQGFIGNMAMIGFRLGHLLTNVDKQRIDLACKVGINEWQGIKKPQLIVEDIRLSA